MSVVTNKWAGETLYMYNSITKILEASLRIGDSTLIEEFPLNSTLVEPITDQSGSVKVFDNVAKIWSYKNENICILNPDNFFLEVRHIRFQNEPIDIGFSIIEQDEPVPSENENKQDYWWNATLLQWEYKPILTKLYFPIWNNSIKSWIENGTFIQINQAIDNETFKLIKQWCLDQNKVEEYYINKGIADINDTEYQDYLSNKNNIITSQALKKI